MNIKTHQSRIGIKSAALAVVATLALNVPQTFAKGIAWKSSFDAAMKEAKRTGKPVMVDFGATWCSPCHKLDKETFGNAAVAKEARKWVAVKVDIDKQPKVASKYKVSSVPAVLFLKPNGTVASKFTGFQNASSTVKSMKAAYTKARK